MVRRSARHETPTPRSRLDTVPEPIMVPVPSARVLATCAISAGKSKAGDIKETDLAEVEQALVKQRPLVHATTVDVVSEVIDHCESFDIGRLIDAFEGDELDVVDAAVAIAVHQVDGAAADSLNRRNFELHRADVPRMGLGAKLNGAGVRGPGIAHAKAHRTYARPVDPGEGLAETFGLGVYDEAHRPGGRG